MKNKLLLSILFTIVLILHHGCTVKWTKALQNGEVVSSQFNETVAVEVMFGLMIVPVSINGKTYRFLLDTGAPFSISEELQKTLAFEVVSTGNIVDTEKDKTKAEYVSVDSVFVGEVLFTKQTALVLDFRTNPAIKCLELDGIMGSNLMRFCNWKIDFENEEISLSDIPDPHSSDLDYVVPFSTDSQYNMLIDMQIGDFTLENMKIDYGSNGSLSIPEKDFEILREKNLIGPVFTQRGVSQKGVLGEVNELESEIAIVDIVKTSELLLTNTEIHSGNSGLVGCEIFSRYIVVIDWQNENLHFTKQASDKDYLKVFGFGVGYSDEKQLYVQSVTEHSAASKLGIQPHMQILKVDSLDYALNPDFCNTVHYIRSGKDTLSLVLKDINGDVKKVRIGKAELKK